MNKAAINASFAGAERRKNKKGSVADIVSVTLAIRFEGLMWLSVPLVTTVRTDRLQKQAVKTTSAVR
jgi:hypothetical protein